MSMPTGDTPQKVQEFYLYLNGHQETTRPVQPWHVDWMSVAWLWGFVLSLIVVLLLWVRQYRTTRQRRGIYPVDSFGGGASEGAGPAPGVFLPFPAIIVGFPVGLFAWALALG